jgi:hypothetical protein
MPASAQNAVAVGDIVQTGMNGQNVVGEVIRIRGNTADLNLGQNNVSQLVTFDNLKVLQKTGAGANRPAPSATQYGCHMSPTRW